MRAKLTDSDTCRCLNDPVFVVKAASSDSRDSSWSVVDSNPSKTLVSSFNSSAILDHFYLAPVPHIQRDFSKMRDEMKEIARM